MCFRLGGSHPCPTTTMNFSATSVTNTVTTIPPPPNNNNNSCASCQAMWQDSCHEAQRTPESHQLSPSSSFLASLFSRSEAAAVASDQPPTLVGGLRDINLWIPLST